MYMFESTRVGKGEGAVRTGVVPQTKKNKKYPPPPVPAHLYTVMHANTHKYRPSRPSVAFLSLPLAVSQIPDDVLTGGLSDWR